MPTKCCVKGCHSKWGREKVKFHRFPSNSILKKQWIESLKLDFIPTYHRVCSFHFSPDSLNETGRVKKQYIPRESVEHNYTYRMDHNYCKEYYSFEEISGKSSLDNSGIKELHIETDKIQNENSSNQMVNLKRKNKVVTPEVLELKKKIKTMQQKIRRANKKFATVFKIKIKYVKKTMTSDEMLIIINY